MADTIETDIRKLDEREPEGPLDGLEADIWAGVAARAKAAQVLRIVLGMQAAVFVVALIASISAGNWAAGSVRPAEFEAFSSGLDLAPSTLLTGRRT